MAGKTPHEELIETISENFHTYLKKGVRFGSVISESMDNLPVYDIEELLSIYFVLTDTETMQSIQGTTPSVGVVEFIEKLPKRLQSLPTSTATTRTTTRDHVEGRIDWPRTIETRLQTNPADTRRFECAMSEETYSSPNNQVLKQLLNHIKNALDSLEFALTGSEGFEWVRPWHESSQGRAQLFREDILQNVHIQRISVTEKLSDRTIRSVTRSRHNLYREAAELLQYYRRLMRYEGSQLDAKQLLQSFFIAPLDSDRGTQTLFELYWIFRLLDTFENPKFNLITPGTNEVAQWKTDTHQYRMFHDCSGSGALTYRIDNNDLQAEVDSADTSFGYLKRRIKILERKRKLGQQWFDKTPQQRQWAGRPDIILEQYTHDGVLRGVFVGDAKYSQDTSYFMDGVEEILEYLYLVRSRDEYLKESSEESIEWVFGGLFTDGPEQNVATDEDVIIAHTDSDLTTLPFPWMD